MDAIPLSPRLRTEVVEYANHKVLVLLFDRGVNVELNVYVYTEESTNSKRLVREKYIDRIWKAKPVIELLQLEFPNGF